MLIVEIYQKYLQYYIKLELYFKTNTKAQENK